MLTFLIILVVVVVVIVIGFMARDRKRMSKKTVETIGDKLWNEIDQERQEALERGKRFRRTLSNIRQKMYR